MLRNRINDLAILKPFLGGDDTKSIQKLEVDGKDAWLLCSLPNSIVAKAYSIAGENPLLSIMRSRMIFQGIVKSQTRSQGEKDWSSGMKFV